CKIDINKITQILGKITHTNVASQACLTKIYRLIKSDKEKRGNVKEQYRHSACHETEHINFMDSEKNAYSNSLVECAINLTNLTIDTRKVAKLCGKNVKNILSRQEVDTSVDRELTNIISDDKQNYLGLREMANKSGASTADTLQQIIQDISVYCTQSDNLGLGYDLLTNIKNTMSDRANTVKTFNDLLNAYRQECLTKVIDDYDQLSEDENNLCGQMNNFFCGLHLLVAIADVCETSTTKFENNYESGDLGSASDLHLNRYHKAESGTLRLLLTCSKVCAVGEDERNGASMQWKIYLQTKNDTNRIMRFKHNRFNMVFMVGSAVFYHSADIADFLDNVHGTSNDLLKAGHQRRSLFGRSKGTWTDIQVYHIPVVEVKRGPWSYILDMNTTFNTLINFLKRAASDQSMTEHFMTGEESPFETEVNEKYVVMKKLIENHRVDEIVIPLLKNTFIAIKQLLQRMIPEHLPGGKFWEPCDELRETTKSAKKHNTMPELVPNASILANEAYIIYSFNKTSKWLEELPEDEMKQYIESKKDGRKIRQTFKDRTRVIKEKRLEQLRQKQVELEEGRQKE
ncbi:hypothetical protein MAR_019842, partial [Mya arenaria]